VRRAAVAVAAVVLVPTGIMLASRLGKDATNIRSVLVGRTAPEFDLARLDGGRLTASELKGKPYVVNFWASWCVPCRQEHANLAAFYRQWKPRGVEILGVIFNDTEANARSFQQELGGDWPLLSDPKGRTAIDFGVRGPPETFVVDARGSVAYKFTGPVGRGALEQVMGDLMAAGRFGGGPSPSSGG
jgi:cytochrome c biogenesis protein CcmG/thiol:disulfide interchange protein DsbE